MLNCKRAKHICVFILFNIQNNTSLSKNWNRAPN
jgi:hypothetical protein